MKLNKKGFTLVEILLVIIAVTLVTGVGYYVLQANQNNKAETKPSTPSTPASAKKYLEVKDLGIKFELTEDIKDAYVSGAYLSIRHFDNLKGFENCRADQDSLGIAAVEHAKVGDDRFGSPWTEAELNQTAQAKLGDTYYWVSKGQAACYDYENVPGTSQDIEKLSQATKAFAEQGKTITKL